MLTRPFLLFPCVIISEIRRRFAAPDDAVATPVRVKVPDGTAPTPPTATPELAPEIGLALDEPPATGRDDCVGFELPPATGDAPATKDFCFVSCIALLSVDKQPREKMCYSTMTHLTD